MKKVLLLITALFLVFTLTACSSERTVTCSDDEITVTFTYNKDEIIEFTLEDSSETVSFSMDEDEDVEYLELLTQQFIDEYGDDIFEGMEVFVEESESEEDVTCKID